MQSEPRLLDLFCGAGGAAMGYSRAGFEVVGVDIKPQPHYPFTFVQADALEYVAEHGREFDAIHASPPCQAYSRARYLGNGGRSDKPRLIATVRELLRRSDRPWVIENVHDAREWLRSPVQLCGSSLGLPDIERHRLFETNWLVMAAPPCAHHLRGAARFPSTPRSDGSRPLSRIVNQMASGITHEVLATAMGIDWMPAEGRKRPSRELCEAIPPAYTEWIGRQLLEVVTYAV